MIVKYIERCKHMLQLVTLDILKVEGEICLLVFFFFFSNASLNLVIFYFYGLELPLFDVLIYPFERFTFQL